MKVSSITQMRALDKQAIEEFGIKAELLMENAGHAAYFALRQAFGIYGKRFLVFCGTGNNGGDGCVLARKIHADGGRVKVFVLGDPGRFKGAAGLNYDIVTRLPIETQPLESIRELQTEIRSCDLIVDAILGTGLSRDVEGIYRQVIEIINQSKKPVLSIDIPSGIHGNSGQVMGVAVKADYTVTFGLPKYGNLLYPGFDYGGRLYLSYISFPPSIYNSDALKVEINAPTEFSEVKNINIDGQTLIYDENTIDLLDTQSFLVKSDQHDFLILDMNEFERISGISAQEVARHPVEVLQHTAERIKKAIILKANHPLIGFPDRWVYINLCRPVSLEEKETWRALDDTIGVLLRLGFPFRQGIKQGVFIHFLIRDLAVEEHWRSPLKKQDFLDALPGVVRMLQDGLEPELKDRYSGAQIV